jgi:hypothetical protein
MDFRAGFSPKEEGFPREKLQTGGAIGGTAGFSVVWNGF